MPGLFAPSHILILGIVLLLIFGPKRLPEIGRSLGHGMREFKNSVAGDHGAPLSLTAAEPEQAPVQSEVPDERERTAA